jgi:hypothetical protein
MLTGDATYAIGPESGADDYQVFFFPGAGGHLEASADALLQGSSDRALGLWVHITRYAPALKKHFSSDTDAFVKASTRMCSP